MTVQEFAAQYKSKNPQFRNMDDLLLAKTIVKAYPEWSGKIDFSGAKEQAAQPEQPAPKKGGVMEAGKNVLNTASEFTTGTFNKVAGNLAGSIGENLNELFPQKLAQQKLDPALSAQLQKRGVSSSEIKNKFSVGTSKPFTENLNKSVSGKEGAKTGAFVALELYPGGGELTKLLKKIPGGEATAKLITEHIPSGLKAKAIKQYSEALGATTKELKRKTERVVPTLLERNQAILSLPKFEQKTETMLESAGKAVRKAEDLIPVFKQQRVSPIIEKATRLRNQYIVNGKMVDEGAVKSIDNVIGTITQFGHKIPEKQLVKIRRILDKSVSIANKNFTKEEGLSLATEAKEGIANTIRNILNTSNPVLGRANKEFNLWADVNKIVSATVERRSTQTGGLTRFIGPLIGGGAGLASGDITKAAIGYFATSGAIKLFQSPAYKTISAINKNRLANYLISGNIKGAMLLTSKLLNGIKNVSE